MPTALQLDVDSATNAWYSYLHGVRLGGFKANDGSWSYQFTHDDFRWAVPMATGEASSQIGREADLVTMLQRLWLLRDTPVLIGRAHDRHPYGYAGLIRIYCQPINIYWVDQGTPEVQARRRGYMTLRPENARPEVIDLVTRFMTGQISIRPEWRGAVHFASCESGTPVHGEPDFKIADCYWKNHAWKRDFNLLPYPPSPASSTGSIIAPLAIGGVLAVGALLLLKG